MTSISLVINTYNEENNISDCVQSAKGLVDEVVVCDMYSEDRTREIAESLGARVVYHEKIEFFDIARRFAIEQARGEWILVLDADERMTPELAEEIEGIINDKKRYVQAIRFRWFCEFMGGWVKYGNWGQTYFWRCFRRSTYLERTPKEITPSLHRVFPGMKGCPNTVLARNRVIHHAYPSLHKFTLKTLHDYTLTDAKARFMNHQKARPYQLIAKPIREFGVDYFYRMGFLDGIRGFIVGILLAMYAFLIVAHQLELQNTIM